MKSDLESGVGDGILNSIQFVVTVIIKLNKDKLCMICWQIKNLCDNGGILPFEEERL